MNIKVDTVSIMDFSWYKEVAAMTDGINIPFRSGSKTARLVEASVNAKSSRTSRMKFDRMMAECEDEEMSAVFQLYKKEREDYMDP